MVSTFAFLDVSTPELIIILIIVLLLFGSKKLPELSKSIGTSLKDLKKAASDADEVRNDIKKTGE